jgi:nitrogen fixation protein
MENDFIEKLTATTRFGKIAVDMEFVTAEQLKEAITEQVEEDLAGKPHRPIGQILLKNGWITKEQIDIVLKELLGQLKEQLKEHD